MLRHIFLGKNVPNVWKGQFVGKEGHATFGLEVIADYDLWIWYVSFGFAIAFNDIYIWDCSSLFEPMLDGTHDNLDFEFE